MAGNSATTRLAAFLFFVQVAVVGLVYFLRIDGYLVQIPFVQAQIVKIRDSANLDVVWPKFDREQRVWGYVDRHSAAPGETFNVMLSARPGAEPYAGVAQIARVSWRDGKNIRETVWESEKETFAAQKLRPGAAAFGADWDTTFAVRVGEKWRSGYYTVNILGADGALQADVASIIVRSAKRTGDVLAKINTNTFQAYNGWGGHSLSGSALFDGHGAVVSFDRPAAAGFYEFDLYFASWLDEYAEKRGKEIAFVSDFDLHDDPGLLDGYKLFVSQGHDEYWSKEMFDAVERRIFKQGGNTVFLGANTAYTQVRFIDANAVAGARARGRQMVSYEGYVDPAVARAADEREALPWAAQQFRWKNRRPETMLEGVGYQSYFNPSDPRNVFDYTVVDASLPLFKGTGWRTGALVKGVVGNEWDNRDPEGDGKRLWHPEVSINALLPSEGIKVLFSGEPVDFRNKKGLAEAVYWESPAGAKVFSAGSLRWDWGFGKPGFVSDGLSRFNNNLFDEMLK
jgi:hypothetical protein